MNESIITINFKWVRLQRFFFFLACAASAALILIPDYPPMVDLPQHAGQIALIKSLMSNDFAFESFFEFQLLTPYWLGYSIILALSYIVDITLATKLTVALAMMAFPISADRFLRSQHGNPIWSWLFIPTSYGFAFEWGFLNFLIATPIGFFFLSKVSSLKENIDKKDLLQLIAWCHFLFLAHVLVLVVFLLIGTLILHNRNPRTWFKRVGPFFCIAPLFLIWFSLKILNGTDAQGTGPWDLGIHRALELFPNMVALPPALNFVLPSILICAAGLIGGKLTFSIPKFGPFVLYLLLMLIGPNFLFGTYFVYNRFTHIGLPLLLLAATPYTNSHAESNQRPTKKYFQLLIIPLSILLIGYHSAKIISYSKESASFSKIIESIPANQRILGLVFMKNSTYFTAPTYLHYPVWYQSEKGGVADFNFAYFYPQIVRYKIDQRPPSDPNFVWFPHTFDWNTFSPFNYSYFLVKHTENLSAQLFPDRAVKLVIRSGDWWLFENLLTVGAAKQQFSDKMQ
jgi:hypothetical protein